MPTLREAEAAGNTLDVDVDQQLLGKSAGGDSLPDVRLAGAPLREARPDCSGGEESTSAPVAEEAMVVVLGLGSGSCYVRFLCSNQSISGIAYYSRREVFGLLRVYFLYGLCIGYILFIVLRDIVHAAFLQLQVFKVPPCDGVEAQ